MSRGGISEDTTSEGSLNTILSGQQLQKRQNETQPRITAPPIPLALPQLLDAERKQKQERSLGMSQSPPPQEAPKRHVITDPVRRSNSAGWPGRLHVRGFADTPTTQETPSNASAAEHDEYQSKPRPSAVKNTIRGLLTTARQRGSSSKGMPQVEEKPEELLVKESEIRSSVADIDAIDVHHLPALQASPDQITKISSTDGTCFSCLTAETSLTQACRAIGTDCKTISRRSTLTKDFAPPAERVPSQSPTKPGKSGPSTPVRGRPRSTRSPGGRPYSLDQRFALSPSRSKSRGSRGSLTFNIKARVSPGRGLGKRDDTELFVTANIESDESDESDEGR